MSNDSKPPAGETREILEDFIAEADELVGSLDTNLVRLEATPGDLDLLDEIFRAAHTIKGTSGFLGLENVTLLTHKMEDVLNSLRRAEMVVTPRVMDILLEALDVLRSMLDDIRHNRPDAVDPGKAIGRLEELAGLSTSVSPAGAGGRTASVLDSGAKATSDNTSVSDLPFAPTVRVDVKRLDALMDLTGELVLSRNSLQRSLAPAAASLEGTSQCETLQQSFENLTRLANELQLTVLKIRMQPLDKLFGRYPRLVRDLAREAGKQIELNISGAQTELDKSIMEKVGDPLIHILRNACDHGIESPDDRTAAGKPSSGTISLSASQEGSTIVMRIADDGRGLNLSAIKTRAVERGLIDIADASRLSDYEIQRFVFEPGFSTASQVTDISGRGVGMDVVRANIEELSGLIELDSLEGRGTTVTLKLPLTLAIAHGLLVECEEQVYILPVSSVFEIVRVTEENLHSADRKPVLSWQNQIISVVNPAAVLEGDAERMHSANKPYVVVVGSAHRRLGLCVDCLLGQEEAVIKPLSNSLHTVAGLAGAAILGDGRVRFIVDLPQLFDLAKRLS
jgi:two-component system chemotaxis sensor kinase CheA